MTNDLHWRCTWCGRVNRTAALLTAADPGDGSTIYGCPRCRGTSLVALCDESGCAREARRGWTQKGGRVRWTCDAHYSFYKEVR